MNPTIYDFLEMFVDPDMQEVAIFDLNASKEIYRGTRDEMTRDVQDMEICSIDNLDGSNVLTINVEA